VHIKKHLSFAALRKALSELFEQIEDRRQAGKVDYRLHDCLMSALAMMFFQDPSLLSFLRRLEDPLQCGNLKALFAVEAIPWNNLRVANRLLLFNDFEHLLRYVAHPAEIRAP
jgi:hypothetical protein